MSSQGTLRTVPEEERAEAQAEPARVTCEPGGEVALVEPGTPLLDAALDQGIDLDHGCRAGACGACAIEVVEGLENASPPDPIEQNTRERCGLGERERLACRMTCRGAMRVKPIDEG